MKIEIEIEGKNLNAQDYLTAAAMLILRGVGVQCPQDKKPLPKNERFEKLSDGWVRDALNNIEWGPSSTKIMNFEKAKEYCSGVGGRMPTLKELQSIVDYERNSPAVDKDFFGDTKTDDWYWTSKSVSGNASFAWCVKFSYGLVSSCHQDDSLYVRPVRASQ